ncbi:unnamed protein product [Peniophora sp. CBMAI 1063]|nr:unnamed protein product [Peniophora sp. CBMAI 1063]
MSHLDLSSALAAAVRDRDIHSAFTAAVRDGCRQRLQLLRAKPAAQDPTWLAECEAVIVSTHDKVIASIATSESSVSALLQRYDRLTQEMEELRAVATVLADERMSTTEEVARLYTELSTYQDDRMRTHARVAIEKCLQEYNLLLDQLQAQAADVADVMNRYMQERLAIPDLVAKQYEELMHRALDGFLDQGYTAVMGQIY